MPVQRMSKKQSLTPSIFRMINEELYTNPSQQSASRFKKEPELFEVYHQGYSEQVQQWPVKPFDLISKRLKQLIAKKASPAIADVGCGQAMLAKTFGAHLNIQSFDIGRAPGDETIVTLANMTQIPVQAQAFDVIIYSLSIMGSDQKSIFTEATRILKMNGDLWVVEISSRVKTVDEFNAQVEQFGFKLKETKDYGFIFMSVFEKVAEKKGKAGELLGPCIYKRR
ncbi:Ribosomal_RNA-processing protein [Hexamita inflata]|uniref:Ribosomal RNA-processing protein 8 n=1 Tax=Hexamita inflata TaxID=28002 RepID=A0ABP1HX18_9EUKA